MRAVKHSPQKRPPSARRGVLCLLTLLLAVGPARAAIFSDIQPGARAMGMGTAYSTNVGDVFGMFHNPASLARAPFTQAGATFGRHFSPDGPIAHETFAYARPLPILPGATVGAGFMLLGQNVAATPLQGPEGRQVNQFVTHFSHSIRVPRLYLRRPLMVGANLKVAQAVPGRGAGNKIGLGLDMGAIFDTGKGLKAALVIRDLDSGIGLPNPRIILGTSYRWDRRITFAADMQIRKGVTELLPGIEADVLNRLLKLRIGKGVPLDGDNSVSVGMGMNLSPVILDLAMTIPVRGFNRNAGGFQGGLTYRFGAPPFYGRFVGEAARQAEDLRSDILNLQGKKKDIDTRIEAARSDQEGLEGQVRAREERLRDLEEQIRRLELDEEKKRYEVQHPHRKIVEPPPPPPKPKKKVKRKPRRRFPLRYRVRPGDTLRSIAEKMYGNSTRWELIYDRNPEKIERGLPVEGAVLVLPRPEGR
jgi:hypothetical protein